MKLAAIGACDDSTAGREMTDAIRQLPFSSVYLIPGPKSRIDRIPISACFIPKNPGAAEMRRFLDLHKPDVVMTWGGVPDSEFPALWNQRGVRWTHVVHADGFDPRMECYRHAKLVAPTEPCRRRLLESGFRSTVLPIPVDTDRFTFRKRTVARSFLTIYDREGAHALSDIFLAWWEMENQPLLSVRSEERPPELAHCLPPETVRIDLRKREDFYRDGDVAIQVAGELEAAGPILGAMASGIPVLTTPSSPIPAALPELSVDFNGTFLPLRERVKALRGTDLSRLSEHSRAVVDEYYSWRALRDKWINLLK